MRVATVDILLEYTAEELLSTATLTICYISRDGEDTPEPVKLVVFLSAA